MMPPLQDEVRRLVELAMAGDKETFGNLFELFKKEIYLYIRASLSDVSDAEDLLQTTFLNAWMGLPKLKEVSKFKSWLYAIAHNLCVDQVRRREREEKRRLILLGEQHISLTEPSPEGKISRTELVMLALKEVQTKYRSCLLLQVVGGFSPLEVAEQLGLSKETVITYTSYARMQLRQAYSRLEQMQNTTDTAEERRSAP
jgi:RNA polymerase sigma-70 factor (ECF subfamily)